jgi:hypothetical protein
LINPIIVTPRPDGSYIVIEGNTRVAIYRELAEEGASGDWATIPAVVRSELQEKGEHAIRLQAHLVGPRPWRPYWLHRNGISFDSLLVEKGNENLVYSRGRYENRFNYAKRKKIRLFVEDDWVKAVKLSYLCDVVFLIDHPYNRPDPNNSAKHSNASIIGRLPGNVIRVYSWSELKKLITQLV